jgi:hypothetical protein
MRTLGLTIADHSRVPTTFNYQVISITLARASRLESGLRLMKAFLGPISRTSRQTQAT